MKMTGEPLKEAEPGVRVGWIIDEHGRFAPESLVRNDDYRRYQEQLPDPKAFQLGDLPPVVNRLKQESPP